MVATYSSWLVAFSVLIAIFASYTALDLASRVAQSERRATYYWILGGAFSMGVGIWSMHFVGMLAFSLPIPLSYDVPMTLASVVPAIAASGLALFNFRQRATNFRSLSMSVVPMGGGIVAMHYTGMAAMRMQPPIRYDPALVSLSVAIAIGASAAALWIARSFLSAGLKGAEVRRKMGSAVLMGLAIAGMHYTGMAAANFAPGSICLAGPHGVNADALGVLVGTATVVLLVMTLMVSIFDARLAAQAHRMLGHLTASNEELRRTQTFLTSIVDNIPNVVFVKDAAQLKFVRFNKTGEQLLGFSEAELLGKSDYDLFPKEQADFLVAKDRETLAKKNEVVVEEEPVRIAGGAERILFTKKLPILDGEGNPQYLLGISEDITERKRIEEALRESESRLDLAMDASGLAVWDFDLVTGDVRLSRHWWPILGYAPGEVALRIEAWEKLTHPDDLRLLKSELAMHLNGSVPVLDVEYRMTTKNGEWRWIRTVGKVVERESSGRALRAIGTHEDTTLRKQQAERIARLSRIHALLSGVNSAIVRIRDRAKLLHDACRIAVEHGSFGFAWVGVFDGATLDVTPAAWAGEGSDALRQTKSSASSDVAEGQGRVGRAIRERRPVFSNDIGAETDGGGPRREEAQRLGFRSVIALPLFEGGTVVGALVLYAREPNFFTEEEVKLLAELSGDISFALEHMAKEEKLNYLAHYDALTDTANRNLLDDRLAQALAQARRQGYIVAVAILDLDQFKLVNDSLGHQAGDQLLRICAARLRSCVRDSDTLARLAGDQFVLVLPLRSDAVAVSQVVTRVSGAVAADAQMVEILERALSRISEPVAIGDRELRLSCSIGVSLFPPNGEDAEALLRNAAAALSRAKQLGGNNAQFYAAEFNAKIAERLSLRSSLRSAVERDEFVLYYQPKTNLQTGLISGAEALLRWNKPGSGIVAPSEIIPVLEETGLIIDVGRWAMQQAVSEYRLWRATQPWPPRIAVNVSQLQLARKDFVTVVEEILKNTDGGLDVEITESLVMNDLGANIPKLRVIRDMGVNIAIDDFGTGYSSLSQLTKLPIDTVKIDRVFIQEMDASPEGMMIVTTIISLAHSLKLKVVAEGVETEGQTRLLRLLKCDEIQGYLISEPLPAENMRRFLHEYQGQS